MAWMPKSSTCWRGLSRSQGHEAGEQALFDVVEGALEIGIRYLSAYAFSTENWTRPEEEVAYLAVVHDLKTRVDQINGAGFASQYGPAGQPPRRRAICSSHPLRNRRSSDR